MLVLWGLLVVPIVIEGVLSAADLGLVEPARLRRIVYDYGGFWPGILGSWQPNYALQPAVMFLSYGFLHTGPAHLLVNMITLWSLGRAALARVGGWRFCLLYLLSILGGAAGFALLSETVRPMVGASGALFGLAGALLAWNYVDRFAERVSLWPVARVAALLLLLNLVMWGAMGGLLAWQTHLGGFLAGWVAALLLDPRARVT